MLFFKEFSLRGLEKVPISEEFAQLLFGLLDQWQDGFFCWGVKQLDGAPVSNT